MAEYKTGTCRALGKGGLTTQKEAAQLLKVQLVSRPSSDRGARCCAILSKDLHLISENHCFQRLQNQVFGGRLGLPGPGGVCVVSMCSCIV